MGEPLDIGLTIDLSALFAVTPVLSMLSMAYPFNALSTGIGHQYRAPDSGAKQAFLHIHSSMKPLKKPIHRGILAEVSPNRACIRPGTLGRGMTRLPNQTCLDPYDSESGHTVDQGGKSDGLKCRNHLSLPSSVPPFA